MRAALVLRERSRECADAFERAGFRPAFVAPLEFDLIGLDELRAKLDGGAHSAIALTSPRAVAACVAAGWTAPKANAPPAYCVGEATRAAAEERLGLVCRGGAAAGDADRLAAIVIAERRDGDKPLLFPCGDRARDVLPRRLEAAGVPLERIVVYATTTRRALRDELRSLLRSEGLPERIAFFSPSGVDAAVPPLRELHYELDRATIVAIGPTTEERIRKHGLAATVAETPTVEGIVEAFLNQRSE